MYEFTTLATFAIAFRFWHHQYLFPVAVLLGSSFMFCRFILAKNHVGDGTKEHKAITIALTTLTMFIVAIIGASFVVAFAVSSDDQLRVIHIVVMVLLLGGVVATGLAVRYAEGKLTWGNPEEIVPK